MSTRFTGDLVPNLVDKRADLAPDTIYAEYPVSTLTYDEGYRQITYKDFANAINGAARWIVDTFGHGKNFETLAYLGPNDVRYPALILGAVKAGYKLFLTSPRNSVAAQVDLFAKLQCNILLSSSPRPPAVESLRNQDGLRIVEVPEVSFFLDAEHLHFPFQKYWPEARSEPLFVVHTSGSTGIPKPLIYTHATAAANTSMMSLNPPADYDSQDRIYQGNRVFITFPPFHGAYIVTHLFNAVSFGTIMIAPTSGALPSGAGLVEGLKRSPADVAFIVPSIVQDLAQDAELLDYCSCNLQCVLYCGGDLPLAIGNVVAKKNPAVESILPTSGRDPMDWKYAQFHPDLGLELRKSEEDTYELFAVRAPNRAHLQPTFTIFPYIQEYASRDLFVHHPSGKKPDLWSWKARADDIIVFLNGEKTNPISVEQYLTAQNPDISAALVIGVQRFQAALLVEPKGFVGPMSVTERASFIEKIWPSVEVANKDAPSHARLLKSHVLLTRHDKPMLRAGKGTVQRSGTVRLYASEIDELYKNADEMSPEWSGAVEGSKILFNVDAPGDHIRESVLRVTGWSSIEDSANFFELGMDSLLAMSLVRDLRRGTAISSIAFSTVYTNPSVQTLCHTVMSLWSRDKTDVRSREEAQIKERNSLITEYKQSLDRVLSPIAKPQIGQEKEVVLLTGSTGTLGAHILDVLRQDEDVSTVFCLNRAKNGVDTQNKKNKLLGLKSAKDDTKIVFLTADFSQRKFGLPEDVYHKLFSTTTLVIHNAWSVNFNLPLASFKPQLESLVDILAFANRCSKPARSFYMSSISSMMLSGLDHSTIPESAITADSMAGPNRYADSKYIAEQLVSHAALKFPSNCPPAFARVGQVAGAVQHPGLWNTSEWFPSLIISSATIGVLPNSLGSQFDQIDWVPVDILAKILVELGTHPEGPISQTQADQVRRGDVYHPLNTNSTSWSILMDCVKDHLSFRTGKAIDLVPLSTWISKVRQHAESMISSNEDEKFESMLSNNPAARLLDFYDSLQSTQATKVPMFEYTKTAKQSKSMRNLEPIGKEWTRKWIDEWFDSMSEGGDTRGHSHASK